MTSFCIHANCVKLSSICDQKESNRVKESGAKSVDVACDPEGHR